MYILYEIILVPRIVVYKIALFVRIQVPGSHQLNNFIPRIPVLGPENPTLAAKPPEHSCTLAQKFMYGTRKSGRRVRPLSSCRVQVQYDVRGSEDLFTTTCFTRFNDFRTWPGKSATYPVMGCVNGILG